MRYAITIFAVALLVFLGVLIFHHGPSKPKSTPTPTTLVDYANTAAEVSMTINGPVTGNDQHQAIKVTISNVEREIDIIQGYQGKVIKTKTYDNNSDAYNVFLQALLGGGFTKQRKTKTVYRYSICQLGDHFEFALSNTGSNSTDFSSWTTSCGGGGTFAGNTTLLQQLFQNQIPDYTDLTNSVQL